MRGQPRASIPAGLQGTGSREGPSRVAAGGALALLVVLDLLRPYLGDALRPWQWGLGALAIALVWRWLRSRGWLLAEALPLLALAAFLLPTYVDHSRSLESDGIHYYAHLRSILFDADLDLA